MLARIVDIVRNATDGCDDVSLALNDSDVAPVGSGPIATALDASQQEMGQGPCVASLRSGRAEEFEMTDEDPRWPRFTTLALRHGVGSCLAVPLVMGPNTIGVLNLYSRLADRLGRVASQTATALAEQVSVLVANAQGYAGVLVRTDELRQLLAGPDDLVAQATGVLMARHELDAQGARTRLGLETRQGSGSLDETARGIVDSIG